MTPLPGATQLHYNLTKGSLSAISTQAGQRFLTVDLHLWWSLDNVLQTVKNSVARSAR